MTKLHRVLLMGLAVAGVNATTFAMIRALVNSPWDYGIAMAVAAGASVVTINVLFVYRVRDLIRYTKYKRQQRLRLATPPEMRNPNTITTTEKSAPNAIRSVPFAVVVIIRQLGAKVPLAVIDVTRPDDDFDQWDVTAEFENRRAVLTYYPRRSAYFVALGSGPGKEYVSTMTAAAAAAAHLMGAVPTPPNAA